MLPRQHTKQNENYYTINRNLGKIWSLFTCSEVLLPPPPTPLPLPCESSPWFHFFSPLPCPTTPPPLPPPTTTFTPTTLLSPHHLPPECQYHQPSLELQMPLPLLPPFLSVTITTCLMVTNNNITLSPPSPHLPIEPTCRCYRPLSVQQLQLPLQRCWHYITTTTSVY